MNLRYLAAVVTLLAAASAEAQTTRGGKSEFYLGPTFTASRNYNFEGGSSAHSENGFGLTLGFAHNFDQKKSLGVEVVWSDIDYRANVQPGAGNSDTARSVNGTLETWTVRFLGTYNFLEGNFTPFITGGLGWTYVDTNIPSGLPQNVCWYYPWYGQSCATFVPTQTATKFSYNAGLGVRMELGRQFVRGLVNQQWADVGGSYGSTSWTQYRIDFGVKF